MIPKSYKKHIAEGKGVLVLSVLFALLSRVLFYLYSTAHIPDTSGGYLWSMIAVFCEDRLLSVSLSFLFVVLLSVYVAHINTKHLLIRNRTVLPSAMMFLLFSSHPFFLTLSSGYFGAAFLLLIIDQFFAAYTSKATAVSAFSIGFSLALGSLFTPCLLFYLPVTWICLYIVRCFTFRAFIATFLAIITLYVPIVSYTLFVSTFDKLYSPFLLSQFNFFALFFSGIDSFYWVLLALFSLLIILIIGDNYVHSYKDKVKIRSFLSLLTIILIFSILWILAVGWMLQTALFFACCISALLLAHYFALAETKARVVLFYIFFLLIIISYLYFL